MVCITRIPRCDSVSRDVDDSPLSKIFGAFGTIFAVIGVIMGILKAIGAAKIVNGVLTIGGVAIGGGALVGTLGGFLAAITVLAIVAVFAFDRCLEDEGLTECIAGVVESVTNSFSSALDELFPFSSTHDRVDLIARSPYWDVIESGSAFVFCTDQATPRRSEIMRCYFYDRRVCDAAVGSIYGATAGGVAGIIAAAAIGAAIGCATIILCLVALLVAAIVAAAAALVGALIGGQIAKAASTDDAPTNDSGGAVAVGDYVSVTGNMVRRGEDSGANVLWFASTAAAHGRASDGLPRPFSYCEVDDEFTTDSCPLGVIVR